MEKREKKRTGLDFKKPIGIKKVKYPSRTAINLVYQPSHTERDFLSIGLFLLFLVALAFFTKFMVIDQLEAVNAAERAYRETENRLHTLEKANEEFDEVDEEYSHYGIRYMTSEELSRQFRTSMLEVINDKVSDDYRIREIVIAGNTATLSFRVQELRDVSNIVASLNESPLVSYVTFSTAATEERRVEAVDEYGNVIYETVRNSLAANITAYFRTPEEVAAAEAEEGGEA